MSLKEIKLSEISGREKMSTWQIRDFMSKNGYHILINDLGHRDIDYFITELHDTVHSDDGTTLWDTMKDQQKYKKDE
jgi:hypothetical protein